MEGVFGARDAPDAEAHANKAVADEVERRSDGSHTPQGGTLMQ